MLPSSSTPEVSVQTIRDRVAAPLPASSSSTTSSWMLGNTPAQRVPEDPYGEAKKIDVLEYCFAVGRIVNERITNSLKYAWSDKEIEAAPKTDPEEPADQIFTHWRRAPIQCIRVPGHAPGIPPKRKSSSPIAHQSYMIFST
ncbi:MAG: hypothetical protein METHP_00770 [Methanoregula sp. SKADARSKE-2]|nr:MAG: hypothetical protein METHP_00770 [Methanoregula sp. SKADARSKE-2]